MKNNGCVIRKLLSSFNPHEVVRLFHFCILDPPPQCQQIMISIHGEFVVLAIIHGKLPANMKNCEGPNIMMKVM